MYVQGFIVPVPADKQDAYREVAEKFWPIAHDNGAVEHVEAWEADVSDGTQTDFRKAVALEDGEKVVFSWVIWPDKATADASNEKLMSDPRMEEIGKDMPFDASRMVGASSYADPHSSRPAPVWVSQRGVCAGARGRVLRAHRRQRRRCADHGVDGAGGNTSEGRPWQRRPCARRLRPHNYERIHRPGDARLH